MKKTTLLFVVCITLCLLGKITFAQSPDWLWAKNADGNFCDAAYSVTSDASGNILVAGVFSSDTIILGSDTLTNASLGYGDILLVKYDAQGNFLWAKKAGGSYDDWGYSVATDADNNILLTGWFESDTISFDSITLINTDNIGNSTDIFIAKYDAQGNILWAKSAKGYNSEFAHSVAIDTSNNILVTGYFLGSNIVFGSDTLYYAGGLSSIFLVKYNAQGDVIWAKSEGDNQGAGAYSITTDASSNILVTGKFTSSTINFDTIILTNTSAANPEIFLVKYDTSGVVLWAKSAGGIHADRAYSVSSDMDGNVAITGHFQTPFIIFDTTTLFNAGNYDVFVAKYDSQGNFLWARSAGGSYADEGYSVTFDANGNIIVAGAFESDTINFGSYTLTNAGGFDMFLAKYDTQGNVVWAKNTGGSYDERTFSVTTDVFNNILVAGSFSSHFLSFGSTTLTNSSGCDIFVAKLDYITSLENSEKHEGLQIFPNPSTDNITIILPKKATIDILNINGQIIKTTILDNGETSIDIGDLSSGVYIIKVTNDKEIVTKKLIKQ